MRFAITISGGRYFDSTLRNKAFFMLNFIREIKLFIDKASLEEFPFNIQSRSSKLQRCISSEVFLLFLLHGNEVNSAKLIILACTRWTVETAASLSRRFFLFFRWIFNEHIMLCQPCSIIEFSSFYPQTSEDATNQKLNNNEWREGEHVKCDEQQVSARDRKV